jgi:hypothetical protein
LKEMHDIEHESGTLYGHPRLEFWVLNICDPCFHLQNLANERFRFGLNERRLSHSWGWKRRYIQLFKGKNLVKTW